MRTLIKLLLLILIAPLLLTEVYAQDNTEAKITFSPINHATLVIKAEKITIYVDPAGDLKSFNEFPEPDFILITDIHPDHLNIETVNSLKKKKTIIIGPKAVVDNLKYGEILNNAQIKTYGAVNIEAVPMYNLTKERLKYHEKGRGNGYVITVDNKRIYISGDTEDIKEMRTLKEIEVVLMDWYSK